VRPVPAQMTNSENPSGQPFYLAPGNLTVKPSPRAQALVIGFCYLMICLFLSGSLIFYDRRIFELTPRASNEHFYTYAAELASNLLISLNWWEWVYVLGAASSLFMQQSITAYFSAKRYHATIVINDTWHNLFNFSSTACLILSISFLSAHVMHYFFITAYAVILAAWDRKTLNSNMTSSGAEQGERARLYSEYLSRMRETYLIDQPVAIALTATFIVYVFVWTSVDISNIQYAKIVDLSKICSSFSKFDDCMSSGRAPAVSIIDIVFAGAIGYQMLVVTGFLLGLFAKWESSIVPTMATENHKSDRDLGGVMKQESGPGAGEPKA
jgi:hypothetical protein